jgi:very-short-patch-repair endonuclease
MTDSGDDEEGEEATVDATRGTESILDVFQQRFPTRSLNWHYRSRHQSLIAFSNRHFYDNKLVIFPAPYPSNAMLGLHYHHVHDGNYEGRQNIPEAMRVVNDAINHMRSNPGQSLGIVTLAITQRDLIELLFDKHSRNFPEVQEYLSTWANKDGYAEPFFIKNLENVQGDERDVIYISTTFGPRDGTGPVAQNFGPISKQGGWRRLNVLFTRAKQGAHVFTSMHPGDIVVDARTPEGTRALRNYIEYARSGVLEGSDHNGREPDSDFEVSVAEVLRGRGFEVVPQLGVAGFFIDLAVRNPHRPGELLAAIECDGAAYHSGASVRDRDRIRQEILEGLGWRGKIFRIWSTDWYRDRATQTRKLLQFLHAREQEAVTVAATAARAAPQPLEGELPLLAREAVAGYAPEPEIATLDEAPGEIPFVEIRDTVTYILTAHPRDRKTVTIVDGPSNPAEGKLNCEAPVATALLGLETDGEEELIVDGRRVGLVRVLNIKKLA